jgi:hypothetical protein
MSFRLSLLLNDVSRLGPDKVGGESVLSLVLGGEIDRVGYDISATSSCLSSPFEDTLESQVS